MSKYRRISSNMEIKDKKKQKNNTQNNKSNFVDTRSLMEKLGIKITNKDNYSKKLSIHLNPKKNKDDNITNISTTLNNEDKYNNKDFKSKSLQKRKKDNYNNIINKNHISSSHEKRLIKKDKKNNKNVEEKINTKKEKDKSIKAKKIIKENIDKTENIDNYPRRKTTKKEINRQISKKDNRNIGNNKDNKKYKKGNQTQEVKISLFKKDKEQKDIKRTETNKIQNNINTNKVTNDFNRTFYKNLSSHINYNDDYKINEIYESPGTEAKNDNENKNKKEIKKNEIDKKKEKIKKFRKNKAISVDKIKKDTIFNFKSTKLEEKYKRKKNSYESQENSDLEKSNTSESEESNSNSTESEKNDSSPDEKEIVRSNKRHLTEMASQKKEKNERSNEENENQNNEKKDKIDVEKRITRSNKRHLTEMASQKKDKNEKSNGEEEEKQNEKEEEEEKKQIIRSNKRHLTEIENQNDKNKIDEKDIVRANRKRLTEITNTKNELDKKLLEGRYIRRSSLDNPLLKERLDLLVDDLVLKQNGGNLLFLKNYEKGKYFQKEIEIFIKNQNFKKKIKISSCSKAGCSGPGIVKTNQDAYFVKENFLKNNNNFFLGVCDGHGERGELVSRYVVNKLPEYIKDLNNENIINIFKKINNEVYNNKSIESNMSGTTVVSLFITTEKIICANLGDSRAAIFKYENGLYYTKNLSRDHKPSDPEENKRIINNNGRVKKCYDEDLKKYLGPDRVWLKNKEEPGLAMSRSIGDKIAHTVGVIDEPEFKNYEYDGNEKFIIIASDGIWEYLHGDDCIKIIRPIYEDNKDCEEAALALVKEAFRKWKRKEVAIDDITAIVVFFED